MTTGTATLVQAIGSPAFGGYFAGYTCHLTADGDVARDSDAPNVWVKPVDNLIPGEPIYIGVVVGRTPDMKPIVAIVANPAKTTQQQ